MLCRTICTHARPPCALVSRLRLRLPSTRFSAPPVPPPATPASSSVACPPACPAAAQVEVALFFQREILLAAGGPSGSGPTPEGFPVLLLSGDNAQVRPLRLLALLSPWSTRWPRLVLHAGPCCAVLCQLPAVCVASGCLPYSLATTSQ